MKNIFLVFLVFTSFTSIAGPLREKLKERWIKKQEAKPAPEITNTTRSMKFENKTRYYMIHVPKNYDSKKSTPLFLFFHGGGGNMKIQANDKFYQAISKSEKEGFIAVFPNGYSRLNSGEFATWNAGACCGDARNEKSDDVGFIREMVKTLSNEFNIDKKKIIAAGMSNGAMMSYRLACEMSDVITSVGAVAGTDNTIDCNPKNPVSILHIHAEDDLHVLYNGGAGRKAAYNKDKITDFKSVPFTISKWVKHNECLPTPKRVLKIEGAYCDLYSGCKNGVKVKLCVTKTGGHSWPGGKKPRGMDENFTGFSATDLIWEFGL